MREFAALYRALDETNKTNEKIAAMAAYFGVAAPEDIAWAIHFLIGRRPRRAISSGKLQLWACERAGIEPWLFGECYDAVGDLAETIALVLGGSDAEAVPGSLAEWVEGVLLPLSVVEESRQREAILHAWGQLGPLETFVFNKLITGSFRVGVSQELVVRALAKVSGIDVPILAHRLMGHWEPTPAFVARLLDPESETGDAARPYPFCLAHPLEGALITDRFPEIAAIATLLPEGTVIDGEILAWDIERPMRFLALQKRIGRKTLTKRMLAEVPAVLVAFDLLEADGIDWRERPFSERRERLAAVVAGVEDPALRLSAPVLAADWDALAKRREEARDHNVEGLMLKRLDSPYRVGRKRGDWWKWKIDPFTIDAVLIYAQRGSGRRASLYTDYTFGLWDQEGTLVPFAKAYSGLDDDEIRRVDHFVRQHTLERFGPVRTVEPLLVMELAFEGIQLSGRHKSGIAVRFPRIARWRHDKTPAQADTLAHVRSLLDAGSR
jgi:DNA ligase-1